MCDTTGDEGKMYVKKKSYLVPTASLVTQMVKKLPTMQETWVGSLGGEDAPEKAMATQGISVLPCKHFKQQNVSLSLDSILDSILS